jgi:hypothetical protein
VGWSDFRWECIDLGGEYLKESEVRGVGRLARVGETWTTRSETRRQSKRLNDERRYGKQRHVFQSNSQLPLPTSYEW